MSLVSRRNQRTIARTSSVLGFGLFQGADVRLEFCPAPCHHGIVFERTDLAQPVRIPALVEFVVPQERCTVIAHDGAKVAVIEHVMAALAGLQIDNCLVRVNAPEAPIGDGSAREFVEALLSAGIVEQDKPRLAVQVEETTIQVESDRVGLAAQASRQNKYEVGFVLDYGPGPIPFQSLNVTVTPESFQSELADCRTFVLEHEALALRQRGLAARATSQNAVVFGPHGVIDGKLRRPDECVRHKILDCVGDFALLGCDLIGRFSASRSGHRLNHDLMRQLLAAHRELRPQILVMKPMAAQAASNSTPLPVAASPTYRAVGS